MMNAQKVEGKMNSSSEAMATEEMRTAIKFYRLQLLNYVWCPPNRTFPADSHLKEYKRCMAPAVALYRSLYGSMEMGAVVNRAVGQSFG
jgi:hypothetical protein